MSKKHSRFTIFCALFSLCLPVNSYSNGVSLLSDPDIKKIKNIIIVEKQPVFVDAYRALLNDANRYLFLSSPSVVNNGGIEDSHLYFTESPYCGWFTFWGLHGNSCRDGYINPDADRDDYKQAVRMARESVILALAYRLSGSAEYGDKVSEYIDAWIVTKDSRIVPQYTNSQSRIELTITHIGVLYAIDLMWNHANWNEEKKSVILEWIRGWGESVEQWQSDNNFEDWRIAIRLAIYRLTKNDKGMSGAISDFKQRISLVVSDQGEMVQELGRSKSLSYSLFAINAMMQSAEIAYQYGIDLYHYRDQRGVGLEQILNYHASFALAPKKNKWQHEQILPLEKSDVAIYELAYKRYGNASYAAVIQKWGRPLTEIRVLQYISLTHGEVLR